MNTTSEVVRVKEAFAWVDNGQEIHLKAVQASGSPVVLTAEETRKLAERLLKLAATVEGRAADDQRDD
jgi:hypothetical protein